MDFKDKDLIFKDITKHLLEDQKPSDYITSLSENNLYSAYPFTMLWELKNTKQSPKFHPEGSVWNHTMMVLDEAAKVRESSKDIKAFMWAALLHDIGKPETTRTRNGKTTSYDHDKEGEKLCTEFLTNFVEDTVFIKRVASLVRYHMHMLYVLKQLPYSDIPGLLRRVDISDMALLSRCDRLGRLGVDEAAEQKEYAQYLKKLTLLSK